MALLDSVTVETRLTGPVSIDLGGEPSAAGGEVSRALGVKVTAQGAVGVLSMTEEGTRFEPSPLFVLVVLVLLVLLGLGLSRLF